jgi:hypothetical protein
MDGEAIRQEIEAWIHENFIYDTEVRQSKMISYLRSIDPSIREDTIDMLLRDMANNGLFRLSRNDRGEPVIQLPSS